MGFKSRLEGIEGCVACDCSTDGSCCSAGLLVWKLEKCEPDAVLDSAPFSSPATVADLPS
jgi:hypothetical protein